MPLAHAISGTYQNHDTKMKNCPIPSSSSYPGMPKYEMPLVSPEISERAMVQPDMERPANIVSSPLCLRDVTKSPTKIVSVKCTATTTQSAKERL
jgi:hypothetical protein